MPLKPSLPDVHNFLQRNNGLIVHFSASQPMVSFGVNPGYPNDLLNVIAGNAQTGLACSVVMPTDRFPQNACGYIGLIIDLTTPTSLMSVDPHDAGSYNLNGARHYPDKDITCADLDASLQLRKTYNEWGLQQYKVCGILAVPPFEYWDRTPPGLQGYTNLIGVQASFSSLPIYSFWQGQIISTLHQITAGSIYP